MVEVLGLLPKALLPKSSCGRRRRKSHQSAARPRPPSQVSHTLCNSGTGESLLSRVCPSVLFCNIWSAHPVTRNSLILILKYLLMSPSRRGGNFF